MRLPKTILVPIDFGDASTAALDYAVDLAERLDAKVFVLHSFEIPIVGFPDGVMPANAELTSQVIARSEKALADARARHATRKVPLTTLLEQGDAREVILAKAKELGADLLVLGTHGRRGIARALLGSVTETVVRTSPIPVLTVRATSADRETSSRTPTGGTGSSAR